jgi:phospholipid transport system substrate-binding protein
MSVMVVAMLLGLSGGMSPARAAFLSSTGPIIAIVAGDLFLGEAEGRLNGSGKIRIQSRARPDDTCQGDFSYSAELGGTGAMQCSDGATATFKFQRLDRRRGYGTGISSRGPLSFTYGLSAKESAPYLELPPGKALRADGKDLLLVDIRRTSAGFIPMSVSAAGAEAAPDELLRTATETVNRFLKQEANVANNRPERFSELLEATIAPLIDFQQMTRLVVARNWQLASPEQQTALVGEFRTLLVRTYSAALTAYRERTIEYQPLRMAPGETEVTVKTSIRQAGAVAIRIDYDMTKTAGGWKVYDVRVAGVSLVANYRASFAEIIADQGIDGLIRAIDAKNRRLESGLRSGAGGHQL